MWSASDWCWLLKLNTMIFTKWGISIDNFVFYMWSVSQPTSWEVAWSFELRRVFFFLLSLLFRYNWAAMTAAFPPNGKGQINLPVLMSANGTGSSAATWKINQPAESARVCVSTCVCVRMVRSKSCNDLRNYNICRFDARWSFGNQSSSRFMVNIEGTSIRTRSAPFVQVWHETLKWILVTERRCCGFSHLVLFTKMGFQFFL